MKNFIISLIILALICSFLTFNAIRQDAVVCDLEAMLDALDSDPRQSAAECSAALAFWNEQKDRFSLTLQHSDVEQMTNVLTQLAAYAESGDEAEYSASLALAKETAQLISKAEKPTFYSIF
ncbi:MAG TPA: DUF4363 family protein [Bacillota bacterium]|nr:DUF4363 family protein [Bacillota bacterium]